MALARVHLARAASRSLAPLIAAALVVVMTGPADAGPRPHGHGHGPPGRLGVRVLSSPPQYVSGGEARVRVDVPAGLPLDEVDVLLGRKDVRGLFHPSGRHALEGVLHAIPLGRSTLVAKGPGRSHGPRNRASVRLVNHRITGPMFSGPKQEPFFCATADARADAGLGPPLDDNCTLATRVSYVYRTTDGQWRPYDPSAPRPADMATTTTVDGRTVDFVVRWERGTIDRFIYSIAALSPGSQDPARVDVSAWNHRLLYFFQGGVGVGHYQGDPSRDRMLNPLALGRGYAIAYSTGTKTGVHYNLQLGGEVATMTKAHLVVEYGEPLYTVGLGGSGGAIQQYVYSEYYPWLIDAAVPVRSYPDMVTQTIHIGDCELLERWMDEQVRENPDSKWADWTNRSLLIGLNDSATVPDPYASLEPWLPQPGSDECINGWRGLSPLAINPHFGTAPGITPEQQAAVKWTHWDDLVTIYGVDAHGFARRTWDNVGVQYGIEALRSGRLTPRGFLELNAEVGGWKRPEDMVQEGCPYIDVACAAGDVDVWSARNMNLSPDGGRTPAPRTKGDVRAIRAAYENGLVFTGRIDIPVIDYRPYLERQLNMHNSRQSFVSRLRMLDYDGDAANQVVWFSDVDTSGDGYDATPLALTVIDRWMGNIRAHPDRGVAGNKPPRAVDGCFDVDGRLIDAGPRVWAGILDHRKPGPCTRRFPIHQTSRTMAGAPFEGDVFKCRLKPVPWAIARGLYGDWHPTRAQRQRLEEIFPTGVCDYRHGGVGRPHGAWAHAHAPPGG